MKHSTMLTDLLQLTFGLHRARIACLAALVIALFKVKTVNLAQLATAFPSPAEIDSHYRRLQGKHQKVWENFRSVQMPAPALASLSELQVNLGCEGIHLCVAQMPHTFWCSPISVSAKFYLTK